ncbi:MAG: class I SAM-dependent methyltransferase [Vicinamibacterales bacterium]
MHTRTGESQDQASRWNGPAGQAWVDARDVLDTAFAPIERVLLEIVDGGTATAVLDVGCGTGGTTLAAVRRLGPGGTATGIDISAPMIAAARTRAADARLPAVFVCADAADHAFEPAGFATIVSRFGVMFFADPVRAFGNLRRAARPGAALRFAAWRSPAENPFMTAAERAAAPFLDLPPRRPGPGQFAFAEGGQVQRILEAGGWAGVEVRPLDAECAFPVWALDAYATTMGPVGLALRDADAGRRARVELAVRRAFEPYVHGAEVRFTAACWQVDARNAA